ncbi:MAG: serine hydrolase [Allopontixanthobacter sediminis]
MRTLMTVLALSAAAITIQPAFAQETEVQVPETVFQQRSEDVISVLRGEMPAADVFAAGFLAAVPAEQLTALMTQMEAQFGPLAGLEEAKEQSGTSGIIALRFEKALVRGPLTLDSTPDNKVIGLLLNDIQPLNDSVAAITADIEALPGDVSVLYAPLEGGSNPILSVDPDRQMAIGSTFKLYILAALARQVAAGERGWADVITLDRKSLPSGQMQNWPEGSPVTLHTLATMMISISDNTATDILLHTVGRDAVEAELVQSGHSDPARALPFLSTLEMFGLKGSPENLAKYVGAGEEAKRRILADFEDDVAGRSDRISPPRFTEPTAIDTVEWFASGEDLRKLMQRIADLPDPTARKIISVNQAMPKTRREEWQYVGYKGGSEPGVLNLTWLLQDDADQWYILAMSWNNPAAEVTATDFEMLAQRILPLRR